MSNKWRKKQGSEPKPDDKAEAVWGDDDRVEVGDGPDTHSTAGASRETEPSPETASAAEPASGAPDPQRSPSSGQDDEPAEDPTPPEASEIPTDEASAEPSSRPSDEFDVLGAEVAGVLRHTREVADRVRAEADERARSITADAEEQARAAVAEAEQEARGRRVEADREIEQHRAEVTRQLDEAAGVLEAAQERDRSMRHEAEQHLADAVAARDSGRAILERATERLARAETVAQDLAAQIEGARLEVGPIAAELQALVEQYGALVLSEAAATGGQAGTAADASVIDLRDSPESSADGAADGSAASELPGDQDLNAKDDAPSEEGEPSAPTGAAEQL